MDGGDTAVDEDDVEGAFVGTSGVLTGSATGRDGRRPWVMRPTGGGEGREGGDGVRRGPLHSISWLYLSSTGEDNTTAFFLF